MKPSYDFSGWATRNDLECTDGRVIRKDAFKHNDGDRVPLVFNHQHNSPYNILGHCILENRDEGVYMYGYLNDTEEGIRAKKQVRHGDLTALSIWANRLKQNGSNVVHGVIREVSLVLAGANPGAYIEEILEHSDDDDDWEAILHNGESIVVAHAEDEKENTEMLKDKETNPTGNLEHADGEETLQDVFNTLNEKQKTVVYALIGQALEDANGDTKEESDGDMKHNVFDQDDRDQGTTLSHAEFDTIIKDAKRLGSLKEAFMSHAEGDPNYGIGNIDYLFPEARSLNNPPEFIQREMGWVRRVMGAVHTTPFSRIKSVFADITEDEARARGYMKGKLKKEEFFSLLKRTTTPQTIYKKQKLDRDDVIDIVDIDVVAWLKAEMRIMLDEEIARAVLVGDGRLADSDDKISAEHIRPIWTDADLYTLKVDVEVAAAATADEKAKAFIRAAVKSRKDYKGTGSPTLFTTEDMLTDCLLMEDSMGRVIYDSVDKLATALRVKDIVTVPVMENLKRTRTDNSETPLMGIIVNLSDYNIGADKGGAVAMFDDFDIDYNQQKYLIETRCSGALIKPHSAIALELVQA